MLPFETLMRCKKLPLTPRPGFNKAFNTSTSSKEYPTPYIWTVMKWPSLGYEVTIARLRSHQNGKVTKWPDNVYNRCHSIKH